MTRRPNTRTMVLGHPLVTTIVVIICGTLGYAAWHNDQKLGSLVCFGIASTTWGTHEKAAAYKLWKREWDAMSDAPPKPSFRQRLIKLIETLFGLGVLALVVEAIRGSNFCLGLLAVLTLLLLAMMLIRWIWRRFAGRRRQPRQHYVSIVAKPIMGIPSLAEAYARLPAHCQAILTRGQP